MWMSGYIWENKMAQDKRRENRNRNEKEKEKGMKLNEIKRRKRILFQQTGLDPPGGALGRGNRKKTPISSLILIVYRYSGNKYFMILGNAAVLTTTHASNATVRAGYLNKNSETGIKARFF
jgi:hypothetical protein